MNSRERIIAALKKQDTDYVPCNFSFNPLTPFSRKGYSWQFPWDENSSWEEQLQYQAEELGLDQLVGCGFDLCRPAKEVKSKVWMDGDVLHKAYSKPSGELRASVRYNELWPHGHDIPLYSDFNVGHFVRPWIENGADLEALKHIRRLCETTETLDEIRRGYSYSKQLADRYGLATIVHIGSGLTGAQHLFGASGLCYAMVDNPGLVEEYLEYEHFLSMRSISLAGELGVDITRRNGFYETADFFGPAMLEKFLGNRLRKEASLARQAGMLSSYTIHTGVMPLIDYLDSLNFDSLFGIDISFKDTDLFTIHDKLSHGKCFWIGPSSTFHLWKGPEPTREAVRRIFEVFSDRSGLILTPCVSSHSIMPWESSMAMIDEWKKLR